LQFEHRVIETTLNGFEIYKLLQKGDDYILLDSSKRDSAFSKFSIIGVNPFLTVKLEAGTLYEKTHGEKPGEFIKIEKQNEGSEALFNYLKERIAKYRVENDTGLPFVGGAIGYFSYDFGCELESIKIEAQELMEIPDAYFVFYDGAVLVNHVTGKTHITAMGISADAAECVEAVEKTLQAVKQEKPVGNSLVRQIFKSPFSMEDYKCAVFNMRQYIREGHIYIANMTHTFSSAFDDDALEVYSRLRTVNPAPFSAYLPLEGFQVLCSSPERFLEVRGPYVQTRPIKGTVPRGKTEEEDLANAKALLNSEKDRSELLMIVDLERNDLSKVCIPGSVRVPELFKLEKYATVYHLVATVIGELGSDKTAVDCLRQTFPGGSITGAPKIRAMEIIDELERNRRGLYTGAIGYFGFDGNADFNIVIRTILVKNNKAHIGVGGGITWESDEQSEYDETIAKAVALFKSLGATYEEN